MKDLRQTKEYAKYMQSIGWTIESYKGNIYFLRKLPLIGSIMKFQHPQKLNLEDINHVAQKYRAFHLIIEPKDSAQANVLSSHKFKISSPYSSSKTVQLSINIPEGNILSNLKKDARYSLRKSKDVKVTETKDLDFFHASSKKAVNWRRYVVSAKQLRSVKKAFGKKSLFLITEDGTAGGLFLMGERSGHYWLGFTNRKGRASLAQYQVLWHGILWAKKNGAKIFDFEGVYDERFPNKAWLGFTHFKKSFGGHEVKYPGAYTKIRI